MKLEFSFFDKAMAFDKSSGFAKKVTSSETGSKFSISTKPNDPVMNVYYAIKGPKPPVKEQVMKIPLHDQLYQVVVDENTQAHYISIGGKRPKHGFISIRGPRPKPKPGGKNALTIKLDSKQGKWHIKPNLAGDVLNISFGGLKKGGSA